MVNQIYPPELQLNKANTTDTHYENMPMQYTEIF